MFQLLAALLTINTYGYTQNSICTYEFMCLYIHISYAHVYLHFHIFTYLIPQSR